MCEPDVVNIKRRRCPVSVANSRAEQLKLKECIWNTFNEEQLIWYKEEKGITKYAKQRAVRRYIGI